MPSTQPRGAARKVLEFYDALGIERMPLDLDALRRLAESAPPQPAPSTSELVMKTDRKHIPKAKGIAMVELQHKLGDCHRCRLSAGRTHIVFGEGDPNARLMFIGEGPGRDEDEQGRPFVGEAGQLLTRLIERMGFKREEVYIANIVKCRPPGNRDPEDDEIASCIPFVTEQARIVAPTVIMALGRVATQSLLRTKTAISRLRGTLQHFEDIPVMPTFHPAFLLHNSDQERKINKLLVWEDALKVLALMGRTPK